MWEGDSWGQNRTDVKRIRKQIEQKASCVVKSPMTNMEFYLNRMGTLLSLTKYGYNSDNDE